MTGRPATGTEQMVLALGRDGGPPVAVPRSVAHRAPGVLHLAVSLQVVDPSGRWVLQRRAASKPTFGGLWANTCCTHPAPGEDPALAAVRRAGQELGLVVPDVVPAGSFVYRAEDEASGLVEWEHDHVFVAVADVSGVAADPGEIDEVACLPYGEALRLAESGSGAPWAAEVLRRAYSALTGEGPRAGPARRSPALGPHTTTNHRKGSTSMATVDLGQVTTSDYQRQVADYWNTNTNDPVNLELGKVDDIYHHHYGLGDPDWSVLDAPDDVRDDTVIRELHRLETAQAEVLLDSLGRVGPDDRLLDAGCGRGGSSIMANARFGCRVDGVTISEYQAEFANGQAVARGVDDRVRFHLCNMLDTGFPDGAFRAIWNNESTMYVDLFDLFREHARQLVPGGRYVCITGCYNDALGPKSEAVTTIDNHYICNVHARSTYFKALAANDLVPLRVLDLTPQTIPYWELRDRSSVRTGIEEAFLTAYREESFHYLLIVAVRT